VTRVRKQHIKFAIISPCAQDCVLDLWGPFSACCVEWFKFVALQHGID